MAQATEGERAEAVRQKYLPLFERQPGYLAAWVGFIRNADESLTDQIAIKVGVEEVIDQSTLPEADRIPDCLDGIPVEIIELVQGYPA